MSNTIKQERFTTELYALLEETFQQVHGIFLDRGTSLFETLETISAAEASRPVSEKCASIAAQVAHVCFYLEVLERYMTTKESLNVDWQNIWRTVREVSPEEWTASKQQLKQTYQRVLDMLRGLDSWEDEHTIGGAMAIVVHTAYHLGEIRQALCVIQ